MANGKGKKGNNKKALVETQNNSITVAGPITKKSKKNLDDDDDSINITNMEPKQNLITITSNTLATSHFSTLSNNGKKDEVKVNIKFGVCILQFILLLIFCSIIDISNVMTFSLMTFFCQKQNL